MEWEQREILLRRYNLIDNGKYNCIDGIIDVGKSEIFKEYTVQYIGKKDTNNVRIFEADIVKITNINKEMEECGVVVLKDHQWRINMKNDNHIYFGFLYTTTLKILGNFFQNPELMKKYNLF